MLTAEAQRRREEMTPKLSKPSLHSWILLFLTARTKTQKKITPKFSKSSKLLNLHRFHYFWRTINHY